MIGYRNREEKKKKERGLSETGEEEQIQRSFHIGLQLMHLNEKGSIGALGAQSKQ